MQEKLSVDERLAGLLDVLQVDFKLPISTLSESETEFLFSLMQFRKYSKGDFVYKQGLNPKGVYWMKSGKIKFTNRNSDGGEYTHFIIHGDQFFGYRTVISKSIYRLSVEVMDDSEIGFIPTDVFVDLLMKLPKFTYALLEDLCSSSLTFIARTALYSYKSVIQRLGIALVLLRDKSIKTNPTETNPPVVLSRNELASYIGTSIEVVVRQLKKMEKAGIISLKGKQIFITSMEGLLDLIDSTEE
jgi:CRP-like cAMP-binding protein